MGIENRGFASMSPAKHRKIASQGGKAAHRKGVAHEWTSQEASMRAAKAASRRIGTGARVLPPPRARLSPLKQSQSLLPESAASCDSCQKV